MKNNIESYIYSANYELLLEAFSLQRRKIEENSYHFWV